MKYLAMACATSLVAMAATWSTPARADDVKMYSVADCAPYTTSAPNYSLLRFRPESVQNQSTGYLYVICPIVRDTESSWGFTATHKGNVSARFRTNTTGTFQCTLNVGSNDTTLWSETKSASGDPGTAISLSWNDVAPGTTDAPISLVCRLPPKGSMTRYYVREEGTTDDPPL